MSSVNLVEEEPDVVAEEDPEEMFNETGECSDGEEYGGMTNELYAAILAYKKDRVYPAFPVSRREDRCAHYHWRMRCEKFILAEDDETLLYYNAQSTYAEAPKIVVKQGEARQIIERIHELIGHLGQKRTQIAVLKRLYWRSVRNDVRRFVMSCNYCNLKKEEGRKIIKAPVNVMGESFDIDVAIRSRNGCTNPNFDRFILSVNGILEEYEVPPPTELPTGRYTFKQTNEGVKSTRAPSKANSNRYSRPYSGNVDRYGHESGIYRLNNDGELIEDGTSNNCRYAVFGGRFNDDDMAGLAMMGPSTSKRIRPIDSESAEIEQPELENTTVNNEEIIVEDLETIQPIDGAKGKRGKRTSNKKTRPRATTRSLYNTAGNPETSTNAEPFWTSDPTGTVNGHHCNPSTGTGAIGPLLLPISAADASPFCFLPSDDPEVIGMQKRVLQRQLELQNLQEQILLEKRDNWRIRRSGQMTTVMGREEESAADGIRVDDEDH